MNLAGPERKPRMIVDINKDPSGEGVTLTTTEIMPTTGWWQKSIAAMRGQKPSLEFLRETTIITKYPSIESLKQVVSRGKILSTVQTLVGMAGTVGVSWLVIGNIEAMATGNDALALAKITFLSGLGVISMFTGYKFLSIGNSEFTRLEAISNKVRELYPN